MVGKFDKGGFKAVESFFGEGSKEEGHKVIPTSFNSKPSAKHQGLGYTEAEGPRTSRASALERKISKVGRRRFRDNDVDEEEFEGCPDILEEEEEAGRTALAQAKSSSVSSTERRAQGEVLKLKLREKTISSVDDDMNNLEQLERTNPDEPRAKKQRRKKVRSRQKNIYKDRRTEKPLHLIPGQKEYAGRPLTSETRSRLHLPISKTQQDPSSQWTTMSTESSHAFMPPLKQNAKSMSKVAKKKSKSKYKNLS